MDLHQFEEYLKQVRELAPTMACDERPLDEVIELIERKHSHAAGNVPYEEFFKGELNFYQGNYEQSLQHYLEAKEVPFFQFFCYRASCVIAKGRGEIGQALNFAEKALKIAPEDPSVQYLWEILSMENNSDGSAVAGLQQSCCSSFDEKEPHLQSFTDQLEKSLECCMNTGFDLSSSSNQTALEELRKLADADGNDDPLLSSIGGASDGSLELEQRIHSFHIIQAEVMNSYCEQIQKRPPLLENSLHILNGWNFKRFAEPSLNTALLTEESRKSLGGHYLRWNGKGVVINPGPGFLENFHKQGLCIKDIDVVIVTRDSIEAYGDIRAIYGLNTQLNKSSHELQIIHYYLNQKVYQQMATFLKPSFKQARHTIHNLEMFLDSPDVEKVELFEGAVLHYFLASPQEGGYEHPSSHEERTLKSSSSLGIRLDLSSSIPGRQSIRIGYISGMGWSPMMAHHLGNCNLVLAAFGNTSPTDYSRHGYNEDSLGYNGSCSLLEEVAPSLMLLTEFSGREGDLRIEVIKKIRQSDAQESHLSMRIPIVLPADNGLLLDLSTLKIRCSVSNGFVTASQIKVVASSDSFGKLLYLAPRLCIDP
jgi:tetratricopeptide (TPR) repeat protein